MEELAVNRRDELVVSGAREPIRIDVQVFLVLREQSLELHQKAPHGGEELLVNRWIVFVQDYA